MSLFWLKTLLAIFITHFLVFSFLYCKQRKTHHLFASLTFSLLALSFFCRIWAAQITLFGHDLHVLLRCSAWISTALVAAILFKNRFLPPACPREPSPPPPSREQ
ncbi:hypothetical protein [Desulfoplanes formicivorans]|uniref:hypothetical protein n=1 Tax=Desulfoplanes formicivorans TaxID=1592317 RepID=UPI00085394AF|nr:hypothetical protein [Desulfoplanes formicivorans]